MLAGLPALRAGRVAQPSSLTGAAVLGRAVRVLRTPTEPRARYAPTQERVARPSVQAARLNRCAVQADAASWHRQQQKAGQQEDTSSLLRRHRNVATETPPSCARASPLGLRPNTPEALLVGRRPTLTATGRSALPRRHAGRCEANRARDTIRPPKSPPAKPLLSLDLRARVGEKVLQGIFEDCQKSCRRNLPPPARAASRLRIVVGAESRRVRVFSAITIQASEGSYLSIR